MYSVTKIYYNEAKFSDLSAHFGKRLYFPAALLAVFRDAGLNISLARSVF